MDEKKKVLRYYDTGKLGVIATAVFFVVLIFGLSMNLFVAKTPYVVTGHVAGDAGLSVGLVLVGVVIHELLHGLGAVLFGKCKKNDVKYGINLKEGIAYCHTKKPLSGKSYCGMLVLPIIVTGIIPFAICVATGGLMEIAAFALLIAGGTGDVIMLVGVLKNKDANREIIDHETALAYYALMTDEELASLGLEETTEESEKQTIEKCKSGEGTKLGIKIALIAVFVALTVLGLFLLALFMKVI